MRGRVRGIRGLPKAHRQPTTRTLTTGGTEEHRVEHCSGWPWVGPSAAALRLSLFVFEKVEQIHQVADRWAIQWNVGVLRAGYGIGKIVPAAGCQRSQSPVGLDELQDRSMVCVGVRDMPGPGVRRNHQRGYPGAVTKVVERLNVAGVVVTSALVEGDDDGCALPQVFVGLD